MTEKMKEFVSKQLPQEEDTALLKKLVEILKRDGAEAVAEKISAMIDELKEA
jgi:hypothetical protein